MRQTPARAVPLVAATLLTTAVAGASALLLSSDRPQREQSYPSSSVRASAEGRPSGPPDAAAFAKSPTFMRTGVYRVRTSSASDISRSQQGRLVALEHRRSGAHFLVAFNPNVDLSSLPVHRGWRLVEVGRDPMWIPEACAQKPSWLVGDRYLLINDARYERAQVVDSYVVYDLSRRTFTYLTDPEARGGRAPWKVLHVAVEGGNVVFYLDPRDAKGPHRDNRDYRHSLAHDHEYVVRRVMSPRDFSFADYRVTFTTPTVDNYTLQIFGQGTSLFLGINDESRSTRQIARIVPDVRLTLEPGWYRPPPVAESDAAIAAVTAAAAGKQGKRTTTTRDANVNVAGRDRQTVYLRVGANDAPVSLPVTYDIRRGTVVFPLGDNFDVGAFVVGAA